MIAVPMFIIVLYAFTKQGNSVVTVNFTLANFVRFFSEPIHLNILFRSLKIALITTSLCLLFGYPAAYFIANLKNHHQGLIILLITLPTWINMLVRTYAWMGMLQDDGMFNIILGWIGLGPYKMLYTEWAVALVMVYNFIPFMILQIYSSLTKMDKSYLEAASDLGANRFESFLRITLPLSLPGVISGITLVFLPAVSSFFIPKLIGGGNYILIGNLIENMFLQSGEWNYGSAISLIMVVIIMLSMWLTKKVDKDPTEGKRY